MFSLNRKTRKLYYENPPLAECTAKIVKIGANHIELDATIAFPEGGGQEADHGVIILEDGREVRFVDARKMYGNLAQIPDFPNIQVDGIIEHVVHQDELKLLRELNAGTEVMVRIDRLRRAQLSLSHTASHLLYLGVTEVRRDAIPGTVGCHIKIDAARFDFDIEARFTADDIQEIERVANAYVLRRGAVTTYPHQWHFDARYWECEGQVIPCGGTHISSTAPVGRMQVRRKSLGRGKDRLSCDFKDSIADPDALHP